MTSKEVTVRFFSRLPFDVLPLPPDTPVVLPTNLTRYGLSEIVQHLCAASTDDGEEVRGLYQFLIQGQLLTTTLSEFLTEKGLSTEETLSVECIKSIAPPKETLAIPHPDWISTIQLLPRKGLILTGGYDGIVRSFTNSGEHAHSFSLSDDLLNVGKVGGGMIHDIAPLTLADDVAFLCAYQDNAIRLIKDDKVEFTYLGHSSAVQRLAISRKENLFVSGSWDSTIKLWPLRTAQEGEGIGEEEEEEEDVDMLQNVTFEGHHGTISGLALNNAATQAYSGGWDRCLKAWDITSPAEVASWTCGTAFNVLRGSELHDLLASGHPDGVCRIWDSRVAQRESSSDGVLQLGLQSHATWCSDLCWSPKHENLIASVGYDSRLRVIDLRSPTAPLFSIKTSAGAGPKGGAGGVDKLLACKWHEERIYIGGEIGELKFYTTSPTTTTTA